MPSAKTSKQRAQERTAQLRAERRRERRRNLLLGTASTVAATIIGAVRPDACLRGTGGALSGCGHSGWPTATVSPTISMSDLQPAVLAAIEHRGRRDS